VKSRKDRKKEEGAKKKGDGIQTAELDRRDQVTATNSWPNFPSREGNKVDNQVAAPTGSKITALVLDWVVQDLVPGFDSPSFEVAGSFSKCAFASTVW
jgi:hypothetical protein